MLTERPGGLCPGSTVREPHAPHETRLQRPSGIIYRFGNCELDTARQELCRDGDLHVPEPQVLSVLLLLLENRNRVVTKSELFDEVWDGRTVSDTALRPYVRGQS